MIPLLAACLAAAVAATPSLNVQVHRAGAALEVSLELEAPLPEQLDRALPTGAEVRVRYDLKVHARRRLWWSRRVWRGEMAATVAFDPVTGRYRCEQLLDGVIVASTETTSADVARSWLTAPPPIRLVLPQAKRVLRLRARVILNTGTVWLVFPTTTGSDWVEVPLEGPT
jgi:hypothetical protein